MTTVARLFALLAPHRRAVAPGVLLGVLAVASNIALMAMSAYLISRAALVTNVAEIALAITSVRVLAIARAGFRYLERLVTHRATFAILADLRVWFFASIEPLAPARLAGRRSGDLLARIAADIETLEDFYVRVVAPPVVAVVVAVFAGVLLGAFEPVLGLTLLVFLLGAGAVLPLAAGRLSRGPARDRIAARAELSAVLVDEVQGIADLVALDRADAHRAHLVALGGQLDRAAQRLAVVRGVATALTTTVAGLAGVTVLALGIGLVGAGRLDGVYLALLPLVAVASFEVVGPLAQAFALQPESDAAARRLFELTDAAPEVADPTPLPAAIALTHPHGPGIEIRGLCFRYGPDEPPVFEGFDLSVAPGERVAIVGPSGSGKSTLVNLLLRFWAYEQGEIRIDGRELRSLGMGDARGLFGVVPQDVHLFDSTIRDNLALADRDVTDERIVAACRMARIHDAIEALPDGYRTRIGENGLLLSGGERQRLAIARAVIRDAPILILDEATANLDVATERELMAGLAPFIEARTTIVISHRASIAAGMDRVVRLDIRPT